MKRVYLAGSMVGLKGFGIGWRKDIQKWLSKYGVKVFNPCNEEVVLHKKFKVKNCAKEDWERLPQELQEKIIEQDLSQVFSSKYVICYFTKYSTGTVTELGYAYINEIPIYAVSGRRVKKWPGTILRNRRNRCFKDWESLKRFLIIKYKMRRKKCHILKKKTKH